MITVSDEQLKEIVCISKLGLLDSDECKEAIAMMATELLALREQTRWRKYPDEKPVESFFMMPVLIPPHNELYLAYFMGNEWWAVSDSGAVMAIEVVYYYALPSAPDAKGGE
jgi:hypothetical protein